MTNQELFTTMFNTKINKDEIYQYALSKQQPRRRIYPYLLTPLLVLILLMLPKPAGSSNPIASSDNITIYQLTDLAAQDYDALAKFDAARLDVIDKEIKEKFSWINDLILPDGFILKEQYALYVRDYSIKKDYYTEEDYTILKDYVYYYTYEDKTIRLALSFNEPPLRDYFVSDKSTSTINDVPVFIGQYHDLFMVTFEKENMYFDIETNGISQEQLIVLLKSILY